MREGQSQVGPGWGGQVSSRSLRRCPQVPLPWDAGISHKAPILPTLGQLRIFPLRPPLCLHLTTLCQQFWQQEEGGQRWHGQEPGEAGGAQGSL